MAKQKTIPPPADEVSGDWQPQVHNCQYVPASELFGNLSIAWRVFLESETYKSLDFGKGSHVLVLPNVLRGILEEVDVDASKAKTKKQIVQVIERLTTLDNLWHIDLAN